MNNTSLPPAVVLGLSPTGLHVVRTLGQAGVRVTGFAQGLQAGRWSRYLQRCFSIDDPSEKLDMLCSLFPETPESEAGRPVLIPTSDQEVDFVILHAERLSRLFAFQDSYGDGVAERIMSKDSFYGLCEEHGVRYPKLLTVTRDELAGLQQSMPFPCMIKPARIHDIKAQMKGSKGWILRDQSELSQTIADIPDQAGALLVQEIVPGGESSITLWCAHLDRESRPQHAFTARKLRQFPPGFGSASLVQSSSESDTNEIAAGFLRALGYRGIAAAEFKRDPVSGDLVIIEINVRTSLWFSVSEAAGRPVVLSSYYELAGRPSPLQEMPQKNGVRWRYAAKDAWSALFYRRKTDFVLPPPDIKASGPAKSHTPAVWSPLDPGPTLAELANFAAKGTRRLMRGISKSAGS